MDDNIEAALCTFPGREAALRAITRWHIYQPMFYRTNNWTHTQRVRRIVAQVGPLIVAHTNVTVDQERAEAMALVHDDLEIIIGDVQAGNKSRMTKAQKDELARKETAAIHELVTHYPTWVGRFRYRDLLLAAYHREGAESWALQLADKLDAFEEAMHEVFAGNQRFVTPLVTEYGQVPLPYDHYVAYFRAYPEQFPQAGFLVQPGPRSFLEIDDTRDCRAMAAQGKPHTVETLDQPTGFQPYDLWREIQLRGDRHNETHLLTHRRE